jgi:hypothetical protein
MLPASFQTPAAIFLVLGGLLSCFAGYRFFRVVLGLFGFIIGALLASSLLGTEQTMWMIGAAIAGGLIGALIMVVAYFVGVALIGAGFGAGAANLIWAGVGGEPQLLVVIGFSIFGAVLALWLQRYVIIVATAFGGAWTTIVGALAMAGDRVAVSAAEKSDVWLVYPLDPAPGQRWVIIVWLAIGMAGVIGQLAFTADKKRK